MKNNNGIFEIEKPMFYMGIILVLIGLLMPLFLNVKLMGIYSDLSKATSEDEKIYVIIAALKLIFLNSIRAFPHYLGVFCIVESMDTSLIKEKGKIIKPLLVFFLIILVYYLIELIYGIKYDFGIPAVLIIAMIIALDKIGFNIINFSKKAIMIFMLIAAIQCLDMIPSLSGWAFGRGEASNDIKMISDFLGANYFLQITAILLFVLLFSIAFELLKLIMDERRLLTINEEKEYNEKMLSKTRMQVLENRTYKELQNLVHDLKTPLTSALALVGVVKMNEENDKNVEYLSKIEFSIESMNQMISEILYEEHKSLITTKELVDYLLSSISSAEYALKVRVDNFVPNSIINVNKIRFTRALINIFENSFYAIDKEEGKIILSINSIVKEKISYIQFIIIDNGSGISLDMLDRIWSSGFSSRNSLGLGLKFVKEVVSTHNGTIEVNSIAKQGTTVIIHIPEGDLDE